MGNLIRLNNSETLRREFFLLILIASNFILCSLLHSSSLRCLRRRFVFPKDGTTPGISTALRDSLQFEQCFRKFRSTNGEHFCVFTKIGRMKFLREAEKSRLRLEWIEPRRCSGPVNACEATVTVCPVPDVTSF